MKESVLDDRYVSSGQGRQGIWKEGRRNGITIIVPEVGDLGRVSGWMDGGGGVMMSQHMPICPV